MNRLPSFLAAVTLAVTLTAAPAQANPLENWASRLLEWGKRRSTPPPAPVTGFVPPAAGLPNNREGGAARGAICPAGHHRLTALLPATGLGLTASGRPSLFFYLPPTEGRSIEFSLWDSRGAELYQSTTKINTSGIVRLDLPSNAPELVVGQTYQWHLALICDPKDRSADMYVQGWVQRVALTDTLREQLQRTPRSEHPYLYASAGLWHETLATLAELRQAQPNNPDFRSDWMLLLQLEGLDKVAQEPLASGL